MGRLMSVVRLLMRLTREWSLLLVVLLGYQLLLVGVLRALALEWELYRSQSLGLHSQCIHSFNTIDVPWSLQ